MAGAVEEERSSGKTKKKTNIFWSTVPVNKQVRNVRIPGVDLEVSVKNKTNLKRHEPAQSVRKCKSDPGVSSCVNSSHVDLLTSGKNAGTIVKVSEKRQEIKRKNTGALKGDVSYIDADTIGINVSSSSSRRASIKNLTIEDKKRVANLIKELAKTGEERELALERLQEERVSFEDRLCAVQEEQASLKLERQSLQSELKEGQELLKKYETELEVVKRQKDEQALILNKQTEVFAQCTQTSPVVTTTPDTSTESRATYDTKHSPEGHQPSEIPQLPVYSNSLFDLKTSKVEQPVRSSGKSVKDVQLLNDGGYGRTGVAESLGLHKLYLREYKMQLHLQEQHLEVQRQQIMLQQHLQMLQQMPNQNREPQHGNNTEEPQLIQHAGLGHTTNQARFAEEVPQGTRGPSIQQQSRSNVGQDFASHHSSQTDRLLQEPQNSWSHGSQAIDGVPMQSNHLYRDCEYGNDTQPVSHNFQKISERNEQCDHLMDHHQATKPNNHQAQYHHAPEHIGEQYLPAESYHQPNERLYFPVSSPQQTNDDYDMYLPGPEQHGHRLDRKNVHENYNFGEGVHGQFDNEHRHYPPENYARQSQQSYGEPEEHIDAMNAKGLHPTEYHRRQSKQGDFSTEQHRSLMNKHRSPTERHFNTKPYTRQGYRLPAPNTYHSSEFNDLHNLRESPYSRRSYSDPMDMAHSMARQQLFYPTTGQHSPRKETSLNCASDVPTDHNDNMQPNPRHWCNSTSNHQSFSSDAAPKTSPTLTHADQQVPLDQYISNYQNFNGYNPPHVKSNKADGLTASKRKMDPKDAFDVVGLGEQVNMSDSVTGKQCNR